MDSGSQDKLRSTLSDTQQCLLSNEDEMRKTVVNALPQHALLFFANRSLYPSQAEAAAEARRARRAARQNAEEVPTEGVDPAIHHAFKIHEQNKANANAEKLSLGEQSKEAIEVET